MISQSDNKISSSIEGSLAKALRSASAELIACIRKAIRDFYSRPPQGWEAWDSWRTPRPWEARALPNLADYHKDLEKAIDAFKAGDLMPITLAAASYAGLSKDLDFDTSWMTKQHQAAVQNAVEKVVLVADQIHRIGYDAMTTASTK